MSRAPRDPGSFRPGRDPHRPAAAGPRPPAREGIKGGGPTRNETVATGASPTRLRATPERSLLWGFHAVLEALRSPRRKPLRLIATEAAAARVAEVAAARGLDPEILPGATIDAMLPRDAVHQGLVLEARPIEALDLSDVPDEGTLLVLDQITDPHNVGALIRTAAAFGVAALITTERHAPEITGVLAKAASGGLEHVPIVEVTNLAQALDQLDKRGFQLIGLDSEGSVTLAEAQPAPARALVLGAEGKGLRRLTRERCHVLARLHMPGAIKSLNVSNACAVALTILQMTTPGD